MENESVDKEILDLLESFELDIPSKENEKPNTTCDSPEHADDEHIREGNKVYLVITKNDQWSVQSTICVNCSVKPTYSKYLDSNVICVVEGRLEESPAHVERTNLCVKNCNIWEINKNN